MHAMPYRVVRLSLPMRSSLSRALHSTARSATATPTPPATPTASAAPIATPIPTPTSLSSTLTLHTGHRMPMVGLGTWRAKPGEVGSAIREALNMGYRHIDGAPVYGNEVEVGEAIAKWLAETGEKRESLFITSKLWNTDHDPAHVESALRRTLRNLQLAYLDLYLVHWPVCFLHSFKKDGSIEMYPKTRKLQTLFSPEDIPNDVTWSALVDCQRRGLVRSLGTSNFTSAQVAALTNQFGTAGPAINQVESHPFCAQYGMHRNLLAGGVHLTSYSSLGQIHAPPPAPGTVRTDKACIKTSQPPPSPMNHPTIMAIAGKLGVTCAQLLLRWNLQLGRVVIPKSVRADRIRENSRLFHFHIDDDDMQRIAELSKPPTQARHLNPTSFKRTPRKYFFTEFE